MAQSVILVRPQNGISGGTRRVISSGDVTNGGFLFKFSKNGIGSFRSDLVANVTILSSTGVVSVVSDLAITYPSPGVISVTGTFIAGQVLCLVIQPVKDSEVLVA